MHKIIFFLLLVLNIFGSDLDVVKVSEAMGHIIGKNLQELGLDFDLEAIAKGLKDETEGKNSPLTEDECVQAIGMLQEEKINITVETTLKQVDEISNGDEIPNENYSFPTADSTKYR
jgi:hypothetical protein